MSDRASGWERSIPEDQSWGGCRACRHILPGERCAAYPAGIPTVILDGRVDHLAVRPGQVGDTVFELARRPTSLAQIRIRAGIRQGEPWALGALEKLDPVAAEQIMAGMELPVSASSRKPRG